MRTAIIPAVVAAVLASVGANAAPMAPLNGLALTPAEPVQFRGGNWGDHPLMYRGNWEWHQRQWDAIEGRGGNARVDIVRALPLLRPCVPYLCEPQRPARAVPVTSLISPVGVRKNSA